MRGFGKLAKIKGKRPGSSGAQLAKEVHAGGMAQLAQGPGLDLPDALAGHPHDFSNLLEGELPTGTVNRYPDACFAQALLMRSLEGGNGNVFDFWNPAAHCPI